MAISKDTYLEWLEAAEIALQALMTTRTAQIVRYGEKEVTYQARDASKLQEYILYLRKKIPGCSRHVIHIIPD